MQRNQAMNERTKLDKCYMLYYDASDDDDDDDERNKHKDKKRERERGLPENHEHRNGKKCVECV